MRRPSSSAPLGDLVLPPTDQIIPVEEWDWDEIDRLEDIVRERFSRMPRCSTCGAPMVLAQVNVHHSCRQVPPTQQRSKLGAR